ncbi:MAG: methyltransferase domain-containing protein [Proteobacteria bacterium]|nr:methyltransferase domain-containing protein [Pseudomonadota bacterium]
MTTLPLPLLRCPCCKGAFDYRESAPDYGLLVCACDEWPVVDGIPILQRAAIGVYEHTSGAAAAGGVTPSLLAHLIRGGRHEAALRACLVYPAALPHLSRISWGMSQRAGRLLTAQRLRRLLRRRAHATARQVFGFFFREDSPLGSDVGDYFILRAGQPRHLAALALLEQLPADPRPVLDLACGVGHLAHYLNAAGRQVVGVDINFFQLWIARHWVAPQTAFICADLSEPLPLVSDFAAATVCSDAWHYIPDRRRLLDEMERCAPGRTAVLTRIGNRAIMPNEGAETDLAGYLEELGGSVTVFHEEGLVCDYLARRAPQPTDARARKWLSLVRRAPPFKVPTGWPHALGTLGFNPIYCCSNSTAGTRLRFRFPNPWYAYENAQMLRYHPRFVDLKPADLAELRNPHSALTRQLIGQFVLIGLPSRFGTAAP